MESDRRSSVHAPPVSAAANCARKVISASRGGGEGGYNGEGGEGGGGEGGGTKGAGENGSRGGGNGSGGGDGEGGVVITWPSGVHRSYLLNQSHCQPQLSEQHGLPVLDQHSLGVDG